MCSKPIIVLLLLIMASTLTAQKLPVSNIYLFNMKQASDTAFLFSKPKFLTQFNKNGYNNQPFFVNDDELYITVQMADDTTQTDIYSLNIKRNILTQVTSTVDSEYSPKLKPMDDEDEDPVLTCVRVEADGEDTQRLWQFPLDRSDNGEPVFESIVDIGYYAWLKPSEVALFITGSPHRLILAETKNGSTSNITSDIGRCLARMPAGALAYVHKGEDSWLLKRLNPFNRYSNLVTPTLSEAEDYAVLTDGTFLMAKGSKVFKFNKRKDVDWVEIADFKYYGLDNISRLAIREGKYLVVVNSE